MNTYTAPARVSFSSFPSAPMNAVSPCKDTERPNQSEFSPSFAYNFIFVSSSILDKNKGGGGKGGGGDGGAGGGASNTYTLPRLSLPLAPIKAVSPYNVSADPNMSYATWSDA